MMNINNIIVSHKVFGEGKVTEFDGKYASVVFENRTCKFVYPDAFEKFIKAKDEKIQGLIDEELEKIKLEKAKKNELKVDSLIKERQLSTSINKTRRKHSLEDGFGEDYHVVHLARQPILTYQEVESKFNIKIAGFGRGINRTESTLVLISSVEKKKTGFVYHDHWTIEGDYIYSGEGKTGDQRLSAGNKAIINAASENKVIHLFVKLSPQEYYYQGIFELVDYSYENEKDEDGNMRKEYKFRLRKVKKNND